MLVRIFHLRVECVEATGEAVEPWNPIEDERPSSSRLRRAEPTEAMKSLADWVAKPMPRAAAKRSA
jgi:hypothetical protein